MHVRKGGPFRARPFAFVALPSSPTTTSDGAWHHGHAPAVADPGAILEAAMSAVRATSLVAAALLLIWRRPARRSPRQTRGLSDLEGRAVDPLAGVGTGHGAGLHRRRLPDLRPLRARGAAARRRVRGRGRRASGWSTPTPASSRPPSARTPRPSATACRWCSIRRRRSPIAPAPRSRPKPRCSTLPAGSRIAAASMTATSTSASIGRRRPRANWPMRWRRCAPAVRRRDAGGAGRRLRDRPAAAMTRSMPPASWSRRASPLPWRERLRAQTPALDPSASDSASPSTRTSRRCCTRTAPSATVPAAPDHSAS